MRLAFVGRILSFREACGLWPFVRTIWAFVGFRVLGFRGKDSGFRREEAFGLSWGGFGLSQGGGFRAFVGLRAFVGRIRFRGFGLSW